jgi:hypothetical protein
MLAVDGGKNCFMTARCRPLLVPFEILKMRRLSIPHEISQSRHQVYNNPTAKILSFNVRTTGLTLL